MTESTADLIAELLQHVPGLPGAAELTVAVELFLNLNEIQVEHPLDDQ